MESHKPRSIWVAQIRLGVSENRTQSWVGREGRRDPEEFGDVE